MATNDLLRLPSPPTAIFVASNGIMPGVIRALRQLDVRVPEDLSLIWFDDVEWFSFSVPPITAINSSSTALAESAVDLLLTRIEHSDAPERPPVFLEVNFELVVRRSTAPPRSTPLSVREGHLEEAPI